MDQQVEDTNLAPTEAPAQEAESPIGNFLKNSVWGIITTNVISQWINTCTGLLCGPVFAYLWKMWKTWHDQQAKKLDVFQQKRESEVDDRKIKKSLDEADHVIVELGKALDGSEDKQIPTGIRSGEISAVKCCSPALPAKELGSIGGGPALPSKERSLGGQTTADEGNSSAPPVEEESIGQVKTADEGSCLALPAKEYEVTFKVRLQTEVTLQFLNPVKELLEGYGAQNVETSVRYLHGSRILETTVRVKLDEVLLRKARNTVKEGAKIDKNFTLQIENWGIYYNDHNHTTEGGVKLFKLQDIEVPTIFSAEYAAGVLRIYGLHLKGAEIKAATSSKSKKLSLVTHEEIYGGNIDMLTCKDLLPDTNLRNLYVYATKPVPIFEGERVINVMGSSVKIDDIHLKKLWRDWLPTTFIAIFVARQLWLSTKPLWNAASAFYSEVYWTLLVIIISTLLLPSRTELWITEKLWSLCFAFSRLKLYVGSLGLDDQEVQEDQVLTVETKKSIDDESEKTGETLEVEGERILVTPLEWEWESFDLSRDNDRELVRKKQTPVKLESWDVVPFSVMYDNISESPWPERVYFHIKSTLLLTVVETLANTKQRGMFTFPFKFRDAVGVKGRLLFLALDKLKEELAKYTRWKDELGQPNASFNFVDRRPSTTRTDGRPRAITVYQLQPQLYHLVKCLDKEYAETTPRRERMARNERVSWDMLWTFLIPGAEIIYNCSVSDEEVCGIVHAASYQQDDKSKWHLLVKLSVYDYDCKTFEQYANIVRRIYPFEGEIAFHALEVYPIRFPGKPDLSEKHFLTQGSVFGDLSTKAKCRYMHYTGFMFRYIFVNNCYQLLREKASGRVMIDLASFWKMNPSYPLGNAEPPCDVIRENKVVEKDISEDPNRKYAPCIVYGFSFRLKKWGAFSVCGFDKIKYNVQSWKDLVINGDLKLMTDDLVGEYLRKDLGSTGLDTISNKGDGCIILCYGPPGTGKTLTAEALADKYEAPMWAMSVSELGITPDTLEAQLVNILYVAHSWRAVLLLDEADVYLEKRSDGSDLQRNAMTGIFLRQIEYYEGVLFLTTNRLSTFDDAFLSRITLFLPYKALDSGQRKQIWRNFLNRAKLAAVETDKILNNVSDFKLNGRQIRNVIHNVQKLARGSITGDLVIKAAETMSNSVASIALEV